MVNFETKNAWHYWDVLLFPIFSPVEVREDIFTLHHHEQMSEIVVIPKAIIFIIVIVVVGKSESFATRRTVPERLCHR